MRRPSEREARTRFIKERLTIGIRRVVQNTSSYYFRETGSNNLPEATGTNKLPRRQSIASSYKNHSDLRHIVVAHTGLEPVISALRGQRVSRLHQCASRSGIIVRRAASSKVSQEMSQYGTVTFISSTVSCQERQSPKLPQILPERGSYRDNIKLVAVHFCQDFPFCSLLNLNLTADLR